MTTQRREIDMVLHGDAVSNAARRAANTIARRAGYWRATHIIHDARYKPGNGRVDRHEDGGYVVAKTGQMVPGAYFLKAHGHGVHYRDSVTVVRLNVDMSD